MADEINQTFGLDASDALQALNLLDSGFAKMQQNLQGSVSTFTAFNSGAGKTVSALIQIANRANAAADALGRLNAIKPPPSVAGGGLPGGVAPSSLLTGAAAAEKMSALLGETTAKAGAAGDAVANAGNKGADALNKSGRAASGFALSLETITRVIGTQLIVRALNSVRTAVEDSFQGFINFNRSIALIQTISTDPLETLAKDVRQLSDEFNAPVLDVARAKYEILSNGFISAAESTTVLTAALKFAKVGISDVTQAADLISTTLNAYSKSADEAEVISAKLFKTIELGRVIGSELATSFGRVAPIAHEVGVSENEVLAAFSSITIGGVKASEAATQIRASLTALLKPSNAMKEALRDLGVETGEQAIAAFGYQGALKALIDTTDGTTTAISKLFPNVRAINGVLREVGSGAQIFQDHLKEIQESSRDLLNQKFELRISSDAEKVSTDLNKVKNFFTVDLGSQLVGFTSDFLSLGHGVDTAINAMGKMAPVVAIAVAGLVAYNVVTIATTGLNRILSLSFKEGATSAALLGGAISGIVAVLAAFQAGKFIGQEITQSLDAAFEKQKEDAAQRLEFDKNQAEARVQLDQIESDKKLQLVNQTLAKIRKASFDETDDAVAKNNRLLEGDKKTIEEIVKQHEELAKKLTSASTEAANDVLSSQKRSNDVASQLDDQRFNFQTERFNQVTQSIRNQQRAQELASKAATDLSKAQTPAERDAALAVFSRAESYAKIGASTAAATKNTTLQAQAEQTIESGLQKRLDAEKQFQKSRAEDQKQAEAAAQSEKTRANELSQLGKDFLKNAKFTDKSGNVLPQDQLDKNLAQAQKSLDEFKAKAFAPGSKFSLQDVLGVNSLQKGLDQALTKGQINKLNASGDALKQLRQQIQGSLDSDAFLLKIAPNPDALKGLNTSQKATAISDQLKQQSDNAATLTRAKLSQEAAEREIASDTKLAEESFNRQSSLVQTIVKGLQDATAFGRTLNAAFNPNQEQATQQAIRDLPRLRQQIQDLLKVPNVGADVINNLASQLRTVQKNAPSSLNFDVGAAAEEFQILKNIFDKRQQINALKSSDTDAGTIQNSQKLLDNAARESEIFNQTSASAQRTNASIDASASATSQLNSSLDGAESASTQIASNFRTIAAQAAAAAASSQQINTGGGGVATAALGGLMRHYAAGGHVSPWSYFNSGGAAKGTDTIPAMLSPEEMVINARSSRRFLPQLQAINAGIQPSFNTSAGDTFHIGDINISGDPNPKVTARAVIDAIRREQRRGTGRRLN